jgi:SpoVK/Ycf46/Vps4 family AAA+-type ATPase
MNKKMDKGISKPKLEKVAREVEMGIPSAQRKQLETMIREISALRDIVDRHRQGKSGATGGAVLLFAGESGAGKDQAAELLSIKLAIPLQRVDLSQVRSKYIEETEENLNRLFNAAEGSDTILFFDEADALFGRRTEVTDAHDRYANLEVGFLFERLESYNGLVILAVNKENDVCRSLIRKPLYRINFPLPKPK